MGNDKNNMERKGLVPSTNIHASPQSIGYRKAAMINYRWIRKLTQYCSNNNLLDISLVLYQTIYKSSKWYYTNK